jgi:sporulation protein YqfC
MSVVDKFKSMTDSVSQFTKEEPKVTIERDTKMIIESYKSLKLFSDNEMLVELENYNILVIGTDLIIEFFSPARLILKGKIKSATYMSYGEIPKEEL